VLCARLAAFNPSLVRLAHSSGERGRHAADDFQSQLGSIGALLQPALPPPGEHLSIPAWFDWRFWGAVPEDPVGQAFNPSLVRLAHEDHSSILGVLRLSIPAWFDWRGSVDIEPQGLERLSIPAWFDWRDVGPHVHPCPCSYFQSQLGSIGAPPGRRRAEHHARLSIPAWFDWRSEKGQEKLQALAAFNPSLVRLAPSHGHSTLTSATTFNPSLVRLARLAHD
jgi:hypothetical protein